MKIGLRTRLFLVSAGVIVVAAIGGSATLYHQLTGWLERRVESELLAYARAAREVIEVAPAAAEIGQVDPLADALGEATGARVTVVARDGHVLGDSDLDRASVGEMENHGHRPEIADALRDGRGRSKRYSTTLGTSLMYVAVPYERPDGGGVVRVALALDEVDLAASRLRLFLALSALLELGLALAAGALAAHLMTGAVRRLVENTRAAVAGSGPGVHEAADRDEIGWVARSIQRMGTELRRLVAELADERDRFEAVLEGMGEAVVAIDDRRSVTLVNQRARQLLGLTGDGTGRPLGELIRASALMSMIERPGEDGGGGVEIELPGTPPRQVVAWATRLRSRGGVVLVMHDVTELRRLETVRRDFVANVSHELRTPLSVIRASAETLEFAAGDDPEGARQLAVAIARNAERMGSIIADLLDLTRIESGNRELRPRSIPLRSAVLRAAEVVAGRAAARSMRIEVDVDDAARAWADERALDQALLNLLDNAVKYGREGGRVLLAVTRSGDRIRLAVEDDGPGIDPRHHDRVFERFYRVDPGRSRAMGGTGLGLAIVKHLATAMEGRVWLEPVDPHGCRFVVELPVPPESRGDGRR